MGRVFSEKVCGLRVEIPAVIVKFRLARQHHHIRSGALLHAQKPDDHVSHLHASVVNVVLNLHALAGVPQDANHRVAKHGVAHVADVGCLVRIDAGVLDDDFLLFGSYGWERLACFLLRAFPKRTAVEVGVQVSAAGDLHARDTFDLTEAGCNFLSDLPRSLFQPFCQFKAHRRRRFAHVELGRAVQHDLEFHSILFFYVRGQRLAQAIGQCLIHISSK